MKKKISPASQSLATKAIHGAKLFAYKGPVSVPIYQKSILRTRESVLRSNLFTIRTVLDEYTYDKQKGPQTLEDLVKATQPRFMRLTAKFNVRGGIYTSVVAEHRKRGWKSRD